MTYNQYVGSFNNNNDIKEAEQAFEKNCRYRVIERTIKSLEEQKYSASDKDIEAIIEKYELL